MLAFQNSKKCHNLGLEITPEMFRPLFRQEISSTIDSTWLEGLKRRFERFFEKLRTRNYKKNSLFLMRVFSPRGPRN